jgi:D-Tyr-tRNAtyr deacylase
MTKLPISKQTAFASTNDGARTTFHQLNSTNDPPPASSVFEALQENLLQKYSGYRQMIHPAPPAGN